jgi:hypothetical protein
MTRETGAIWSLLAAGCSRLAVAKSKPIGAISNSEQRVTSSPAKSPRIVETDEEVVRVP